MFNENGGRPTNGSKRQSGGNRRRPDSFSQGIPVHSRFNKFVLR